jgi:hypothetical protein
VRYRHVTAATALIFSFVLGAMALLPGGVAVECVERCSSSYADTPLSCVVLATLEHIDQSIPEFVRTSMYMRAMHERGQRWKMSMKAAW